MGRFNNKDEQIAPWGPSALNDNDWLYERWAYEIFSKWSKEAQEAFIKHIDEEKKENEHQEDDGGDRDRT